MKKTLFALAIGALILFQSFGLVKEENMIPQDPAIQSGVLANGMDYYLLQNDLPMDRTELRLIVRTGSVLEREDQLGLAHFLEHMAFNGTEAYPKNELIEYLQSLGMDFGPEINAYTSFDETVYKLSVPSENWLEVQQGLEVLEQWAFHISLQEEDIDAERPVIIEEWRSSRSATARMQEAAYPEIFANSLYGQRLPIGTVESIETFDYSSLRDFYQDWYRPELMSLIVVGDFNMDQAADYIESRFGAYENDSSEPERYQPEIPSHSSDIYSLQSDSETSYSSLEIIKKLPSQALETVEDYRVYIASQIYLSMFNNRMANALRQGEPSFIDGYATVNTGIRPLEQFSMGVITGPDQLAQGFEDYWREVERILRYGFSEAEWEQSLQEIRASYEYLYRQKDSLYSRDLAEMLQYSVLKNEVAPPLDWEWETSLAILDDITQEEVLLQAARWQGPGNRVFFSMERLGEEQLSQEVIEEIMTRLSQERILPQEPERELGELIPTLPRMGSATAIYAPGEWDAPQELGVTLIELDNGARVFLKPTDFRENEILFRAYSRGGASTVDLENYISAALATIAVSQGGLGEFSISDLERLLADKYISISASLEDYSESMTGFASPVDMETLLQMVYLYFSSPTYDESSWQAYNSRLAPYLESLEIDPMEQYRRLLSQVLYDGHPRKAPLTMDNIDEMNYQESFRIFKERFLTGGDFDFYLVGDIDQEVLLPLIEQWIGALPPQEERETWQDNQIRYSMEDQEEILYMGEDDLALVTLIHTGTMDWSLQSQFQLEALGKALEDRYLELIREELGGTYSVQVYAQSHGVPVGEYALYTQFSCDPQRVEELLERIAQEEQRFMDGTELEKYAESVVESGLNTLEDNKQTNRWWLGELNTLLSQISEEELADWRPREEMIQELDSAQLQAAAQQYLTGSAQHRVILLPAQE